MGSWSSNPNISQIEIFQELCYRPTRFSRLFQDCKDPVQAISAALIHGTFILWCKNFADSVLMFSHGWDQNLIYLVISFLHWSMYHFSSTSIGLCSLHVFIYHLGSQSSHILLKYGQNVFYYIFKQSITSSSTSDA